MAESDSTPEKPKLRLSQRLRSALGGLLSGARRPYQRFVEQDAQNDSERARVGFDRMVDKTKGLTTTVAEVIRSGILASDSRGLAPQIVRDDQGNRSATWNAFIGIGNSAPPMFGDNFVNGGQALTWDNGGDKLAVSKLQMSLYADIGEDGTPGTPRAVLLLSTSGERVLQRGGVWQIWVDQNGEVVRVLTNQTPGSPSRLTEAELSELNPEDLERLLSQVICLYKEEAPYRSRSAVVPAAIT